MRKIGKIIGYLLGLGAGILMFIYWIIAISNWLGPNGIILAIVLAPTVAIFPFIFWIVEGTFPTSYFILWVISILGLIIVEICSKDELNNNKKL